MSAFISPIVAVLALTLLSACVHGVTSYQVATHKGCSYTAGAGLTCTGD